MTYLGPLGHSYEYLQFIYAEGDRVYASFMLNRLHFQQKAGHVVRLQGVEVRLSPIEFPLLEQLVTHAGKVLSHRMLLQRIWGPEYGGEAEYLRVYINRLRQKLEHDPAHPRYLLTEPGVGYRFVAPGSEGTHKHPTASFNSSPFGSGPTE